MRMKTKTQADTAKPTKAAIRKWVAALRSGEYKQTIGTLQNSHGHCCLGVACEIFTDKYKRDYNKFLIGGSPEIEKGAPVWLDEFNNDFSRITKEPISRLNDGLVECETIEPFDFDEIADLLELVYIHEAFGKQTR